MAPTRKDVLEVAQLELAQRRSAELAALCDAFACIGESCLTPEKETLRYLGSIGVRLADEAGKALGNLAPR